MIKILKNTGIIWSLLSAFLWGTVFITGKFLMQNNLIDPISLSAIRFTLAGIILSLYTFKVRRSAFYKLKKQFFFNFFIFALIGITGMSVILLFGQKYTSANNSSFIMQMNPILMIILGIFWKIIPSKKNILGMIISVIGCLMLIDILTPVGFRIDIKNNFGDLLVASSAFCWALYSLMAKETVEIVGGLISTTWIINFGAIQLLLAAFLIPRDIYIDISISTITVILYLAIFPTAIAFLAWFKAMKRIDLSLLNIMQFISPIFTLILAYLFSSIRNDFNNYRYLCK